jgi:hypothetical protein
MDINFGGFPKIIKIEEKTKKKYSFSNVNIPNDENIIKVSNILLNSTDNKEEK